jgi:hypothetical protein
VPDMPTGALIRLYRIQRRMSTVSLAKVLGVRTSALVGEAPSELSTAMRCGCSRT